MNVAGLFDLTGRRALITGSSQGIGLAIAAGLAGAGASVIINGRDQAKVMRAVESLAAAGHKAEAAAFDVCDTGEIKAAVARLEAAGPIDILVNNAGIQHRMPMVDFPEDDYRRVMRTNIDSAFFMCQAVGRQMVQRNRGKIINIGSLMSELGRTSIVPYTASKGAMKMLTRGLCAEWGKHNIQVNCIGPGYIETELNKALIADEKFSAWVCSRTPTGRWAKVEELIGAAVFLAAPASDYVNGQLLMVDGGMSAVV